MSHVYPNEKDRKKKRNGIAVRVIEYRLNDIPDSEELYTLITTILDPEAAPATELAALYHERWVIETAIGELKTHLRGSRIVLRSKIPELVKQEFYGFLLAHFAIRSLMHEAAMEHDIPPDRISFIHAVRVVRRKLPMCVAFSPYAPGITLSNDPEGVASRTHHPFSREKSTQRRQKKDEQLQSSPKSISPHNPI